MALNIHVHHHADPRLFARIDRLEETLEILIERTARMTVDMSRLGSDVAAVTDAITNLTAITETVLAENQIMVLKLRELQAATSEVGVQAALDELASKLEIATKAALEEIAAATQTPAETPSTVA